MGSQGNDNKTKSLQTYQTFNVGDEIYYDRFPGSDDPLPGKIDAILEPRFDIVRIWVTCKGERYIAPLSKLSLKTQIL